MIPVFRYLDAIQGFASVTKNSRYKTSRGPVRLFSYLENKRIRPLVNDGGYKVIPHIANAQDCILFCSSLN